MKTKDEVLNKDKFVKAALISTAEGKTITSTYLAKSVEMLEIGETIILDTDSEMQGKGLHKKRADRYHSVKQG